MRTIYTFCDNLVIPYISLNSTISIAWAWELFQSSIFFFSKRVIHPSDCYEKQSYTYYPYLMVIFCGKTAQRLKWSVDYSICYYMIIVHNYNWSVRLIKYFFSFKAWHDVTLCLCFGYCSLLVFLLGNDYFFLWDPLYCIYDLLYFNLGFLWVYVSEFWQ